MHRLTSNFQRLPSLFGAALLALAVMACNGGTPEQFAQQDEQGLNEDVGLTTSASKRVIPPTEEMLAAALAGQPLPMLPASLCPTANTCPAEYGSCSSWSQATTCSDAACGSDTCTTRKCVDWEKPHCLEWEITSVPARWDSSWSYRVCFNQAGSACTEYTIWSRIKTCGC